MTFYNRDLERSALRRLLSESPHYVSVFVGPRNTGKSAFFKDFTENSYPNAGWNLIDCRVGATNSPHGLAKVLVEKGVSPLSEVVKGSVGSILQALPLPKQLGYEGRDKEYKLSDVLDFYGCHMDTWIEKLRIEKNGMMYPVIALDEANVLMTWSKDYEAELQSLLNFFVSVSKASCKCHILLITSEYSFLSWLSRALRDNYRAFVIGDMPEEEARDFLFSRKPGFVDDDSWPDIFQVCGGNPGDLLAFSADLAETQNLKQALASTCKDRWLCMTHAMKPSKDDGYTGEDYGTVVDAILNSSFGVVPVSKINIPRETIEVMVKNNVIAARPNSHWARDMCDEAFENEALVITAPSAIHMFLMRKNKEAIFEATGIMKHKHGRRTIRNTTKPLLIVLVILTLLIKWR